MNWFDWLLITWWIVGVLLTISLIGRERKPVTPATAVTVTIINALLIVGLVATA